MKTLKVVLIALLVSFFLQITVAAQQKQAELKPTGLALEVTHARGAKPTYQIVPNTVWYGRFNQLANWKPAEDFLPVQAVNITAKMEGPAVRVEVSVHQGKKLFEKQDMIGSYLLKENEKLTVYDMTAYGLEPFEVVVIRVEPKSASVPAVTSNVRSIEVKSVEAVAYTFPLFNLTLRNTSDKTVVALFMELLVDGRLRVSAMPHSKKGEPLIAAGGTYEYKRTLSTDTREAGGGYVPETSPNQSLFIKAAVFDDGTYEGDGGSAARYRAFMLGQRTQLARLIAIYNRALQSTEADAGVALSSLREQVNALGAQPDAAAVEKLLSEVRGFSDRSQVKEAAEVVMFELKKDAVKEIDEFRRGQSFADDKDALRAWLLESRDRYQTWHDRLKRL